MAVKVVRRPELTFWEKIYIPQILCGLKITFSHFFRNLFLHKRDPTGNLIAPGWQQLELPSDSGDGGERSYASLRARLEAD